MRRYFKLGDKGGLRGLGKWEFGLVVDQGPGASAQEVSIAESNELTDFFFNEIREGSQKN